MEEATSSTGPRAVELLSLANEFNELGGYYFALYLTILSGYLVVAYVAGSQLTRGQLRLVNTMFVLSSFYFLWSTMTMWLAGLSTYLQADPDGWVFSLYLTAILNICLILAMLVGVFAGVQFMNQIRREKMQ
ncbi:MAG: hypothetical protein AAF699_21055 [Pseudomonadota bacterium]